MMMMKKSLENPSLNRIVLFVDEEVPDKRRCLITKLLFKRDTCYEGLGLVLIKNNVHVWDSDEEVWDIPDFHVCYFNIPVEFTFQTQIN